MLSTNEILHVRRAINRELFGDESVLTMEDVAQMQPIPGTRMGDSLTVLAIQYGDSTILVWVQFMDYGLYVKKVKRQAW